MKVTSTLFQHFHLDPTHRLLNGRCVQVLQAFFKELDIHGTGALNDLQFLAFMKTVTDLSEKNIYRIFDMFDVDDSGTLEFDEFYLLTCMLVAIKDKEEKNFLYRHWRTCFELLDEDGSQSITTAEFEKFGFIFNIGPSAARQIFRDFDVDGSKELDYDEFRMFALACIDKQHEIEQRMAKRAEEKLKKKMQRLNKGGGGIWARILSGNLRARTSLLEN